MKKRRNKKKNNNNTHNSVQYKFASEGQFVSNSLNNL